MFCEDCGNRTCLKSNRPCKEVEIWLKKQGIKSANFIRPELSKKQRKEKGRWLEIPASHRIYKQFRSKS